MSAVVLLVTGGLAAATALYDDARTGGSPSADRLRSSMRPTRGYDRTLPSASTPTLERRPQTQAPPARSRAEGRTRRTADRATHAAPLRPTRTHAPRPSRPIPALPTRPSLSTDGVSAGVGVETSPTGPQDPAPETSSPPPDRVAPQTRVVSGPTEEDENTPLEFTASEPATFDCSLDEGPFRSCSSPQEYDDVGAGWHTVEVRAADKADNRDATPDTWRWHAESDEQQGSDRDDQQEEHPDEGPVERLLPDGDLAP